MKNRLRETWAAGKPAVNGWLSVPSTVTAEISGMADFDSLLIDVQHGLVDYQMALTMMQALSGSDATPLARVPWNEPGIIMKLLDAGALGIVCPMINTRADAEKFVGACTYAPDGYRSSGPTRAGMIHTDYHNQANANIVSMAMVETVEALENVDEIATTPGLTGIYVGPSDLAISMGFQPGLDRKEPEMVAAIDKILSACKNAKIVPGLHCMTPAYAKQMFANGFRFATLASDVRIFTAGVNAIVAEARS
ncbi:MAG: 2,4-dihydroxyhept-2-ene-1,7-dioic acid aldolase [Rhodospirillaceae bacterium]|nr:2,4-dihydroxyhept-2-ene-1,7-dioic acid aldolase [Rhodospirillaceae bacterium]